MESAIGYVVLTSFLVFVLVSSTSNMAQYASSSNMMAVAVVRTNILEMVREQLVESYRAARTAGGSLCLYINVPKNIYGKTFVLKMELNTLTLESAGVSVSSPLPPLSQVVWSASTYVSGTGKLVILASWSTSSIAISLSGG